jgi:hypothetical protein
MDVMTLLETGLDSYRQGRWLRFRESRPIRRLHGH